jgi:dihydropteroate synthase
MTKTKLMGILNVTPDSCFDGGFYFEVGKAVERARQIASEGADWIDIGGESTRPGASPVSLEEELHRVLPVIKCVKEELTIPLSIDTYKPEVAKLALELGASMVNDITGFSQPQMVCLAKEYRAKMCVMHMQGGGPQTMQKAPHYPRGIVLDLKEWFERKLDHLLSQGISPSQIYLDPGLGFGKALADNFEILQNLEVFINLGFPLVLGHSRKSFMLHFLNKQTRGELLPASLSVAAWGVLKGVEMLRVHDVGHHADLAKILSRLIT